MPKTIYTAEADVTGGRAHGHGATSDGTLDVQLRPPTDDAERGTNPEQLFAVGYAACFEGALGAVARRQKLELGDVADRLERQPRHHRGPRLHRGRRARRLAPGM